jgi:hypothetical protein
MQNIWKNIKLFIVLICATATQAGGVEPVLMGLDGSAIEDQAKFHAAHGIVRDWQYDLLYKEGPKSEDAGAALNSSLELLGVKVMMVPTSLWQLIFCEVNILNPEFERIKSYVREVFMGTYPHDAFSPGETCGLFDYGSNAFKDAETDTEAYDIIHAHSKSPRMSRLKQLVDSHLLTHYPEVHMPDQWGSIIERDITRFAERRGKFTEYKCSPIRSPVYEYPEDPTLCSPNFMSRGGEKLETLLHRIPQMVQIMEVEWNSLAHKTLILMRATAPKDLPRACISLHAAAPALEGAHVLQDTPIKFLDGRGRSTTSLQEATHIDEKVMNSVSYANSFFGGLASNDDSANLHYYWGPGRDSAISILEIPAGIPSAIRALFWLPPFFGPLEMIRRGEYHPRLKVLPTVSGGRAGIHAGQNDDHAFDRKPLFQLPPAYSPPQLGRDYHAFVANSLVSVIPSYDKHEGYPHSVDSLRASNGAFARDLETLMATSSPSSTSAASAVHP